MPLPDPPQDSSVVGCLTPPAPPPPCHPTTITSLHYPPLPQYPVLSNHSYHLYSVIHTCPQKTTTPRKPRWCQPQSAESLGPPAPQLCEALYHEPSMGPCAVEELLHRPPARCVALMSADRRAGLDPLTLASHRRMLSKPGFLMVNVSFTDAFFIFSCSCISWTV